MDNIPYIINGMNNFIRFSIDFVDSNNINIRILGYSSEESYAIKPNNVSCFKNWGDEVFPLMMNEKDEPRSVIFLQYIEDTNSIELIFNFENEEMLVATFLAQPGTELTYFFPWKT